MRYLRTSGDVGIRRPRPADAAAFVAAARRSRELHHPWLAAPDTPEKFTAYLAKARRRDQQSFLFCDRPSGQIAGYVNISGIIMGPLRGGFMGYAAFLPYAGTGHASTGIGLVLAYAFDTLGLHRVEANIQPGNEPSRRVARRLGFRQEGYSPDYLFIDGAWRDHERWALTAPASER
ncbi:MULTISPECIES: GNAT family N-acetyltransferase [unclassified Micromonospora]|uniref:GNAT family N-acetyltransferase n=1 Tax=unclassified Micromonospora TaxID=2617518 RepID=UPI001042CB60|nr:MULTISPECIES: GNAT family protein [unclassified Micromonospora]TDB71636.1 N-acetyltransferase [Micromonospora sp. KC721]TDC41282.1 N-acetyltransferase [Micromonospora sp. KC213]